MKRINELLPISFLMIDYLTYCFSSGHVEIIVPSTPLKVLSMENQSEGSFLGFYQLIIIWLSFVFTHSDCLEMTVH